MMGGNACVGRNRWGRVPAAESHLAAVVCGVQHGLTCVRASVHVAALHIPDAGFQQQWAPALLYIPKTT